MNMRSNQNRRVRLIKRYSDGGLSDPPQTPETSADVTRNPVLRDVFGQVISNAESSPEGQNLREVRELNRDQGFASEQNINRAGRRFRNANPEVFRNDGAMMTFDQNRLDDEWVNFTELVKSGDEGALRMLSSMDEVYRSKYPTPELRPVSRMFGVD